MRLRSLADETFGLSRITHPTDARLVGSGGKGRGGWGVGEK